MAILLIDGNNLSAALQQAGLSDGGDEALATLVRGWVYARQRKRGKAPDVRLFLDAGAAGRAPAGHGALSVRVAPHGVPADDAIVNELGRVADRVRRGEVVVVTSDRGLAERSRKAGASVRGCPEFAVELQAVMGTGEVRPPTFSAQDRKKLEADFGVRPSASKPHVGVRVACASDVTALSDPKALLALASEGPAWARRRAVRVLARLDTAEAPRALRGLLAHRVPGVRAEAAAALATARLGEAAQWLVPLASDPYPMVRAAAARALQAIGGAQAEGILSGLRRDPRRRVRRAAGAVPDARPPRL